EDRAEFVRRDGTMTTTLEVVVSPEDDAEVRRVSITNSGSRVREIELTSYAEIVLATTASDTAHPAFSKMFVQTEFDVEVGALLATRRLRSPTDATIWARIWRWSRASQSARYSSRPTARAFSG